MKKILVILLCLTTIITPVKVHAKSYNFNSYYCDEKQDLGDGTFYMTCHILATTDFDVNHIEGTLILKNVQLESIKTSSDWVSNNGLSSDVSFTSSTSHSGSFSVADLVFTGDLNADECEASFMPTLVEEVVTNEPEEEESINKVCAIIDDEYYGAKGTQVTEEEYFEQCCNYVCSVVDNKYYFNSQGKSVSYDEFLDDCSTSETIENVESIETTVANPQTGIDYGYIILPIGVLSIIAIIKFTKKNSKIYKI